MEVNIKILEEMLNSKEPVCNYILKHQEIEAISNLLTRYKQLEEENKQLREYIVKAPNLDEMTAVQYTKIQEEAYIMGRAEERQRAKEIIHNDFIPKSKVKEQIKWLDNDIKNTKNKLEQGKRPYPNYISEHRRLRMKAFITKSKEIKERLQNLIREE